MGECSLVCRSGDRVGHVRGSHRAHAVAPRGGADVILRLNGGYKLYHATVFENDPEQVREALIHYLGVFPQDAGYHDIRLNKDKSLVSEDLEHASKNSIVVEARPIG